MFETSPPTLQLKIKVTSRIVSQLLVEKLIQCSMPTGMKGERKLTHISESNFTIHRRIFPHKERNERISYWPKRT